MTLNLARSLFSLHRFSRIRAASLSLLLFFVSAHAQNDSKISVSVSQSGEDSVGNRLTFALRETVRSSSGYTLVSDSSAVLSIDLVTLDPEKNDKGTWTVAAYTISMRNENPFVDGHPETWYPILLTSGVLTAGTSRVKESAEGILANLDEAIEEFRAAARQKD